MYFLGPVAQSVEQRIEKYYYGGLEITSMAGTAGLQK
jgi:hypothetical protein